jgi:hypothetical protein
MTNVFEDKLKSQIKKNFSTFKTLSIVISILFIIFLLVLIFIHKRITKVQFIIISTILFSDYIISIYYSLKTTLYYNRLNKVVNSNHKLDKITGYVKSLDTYPITVNGLLYYQYEIKHEITQVFYVLNGIDISIINGKMVSIYILNNIIYSYEVSNE